MPDGATLDRQANTPTTPPDGVSRSRAWLESVHVGALAFWMGALGVSGAVAAIIFPMMRDMEPRLGAYAAYEGEHWRIAAGRVANQVFRVADWVQIVCGLIAVAALIALTRRRAGLRLADMTVRWALSLLLAGCLVYTLGLLRPRMAGNASAYWAAAHAGDTRQAERYREAFSADHPTSTRVMGVTAGGLLLAVASAWLSMTPARGRRGAA